MKIDIIRELVTAQQRAEIIREQCWRAASTGTRPDVEYINNQAIHIDDILGKLIIELKSRRVDMKAILKNPKQRKRVLDQAVKFICDIENINPNRGEEQENA